MPEIPTEAVQAAVDAVLAKEWRPDAPWSVHAKHRYDSGCAVCREDVPAVVTAALEAAAPYIAAQALIQERRRAIRLVRRTLVPRGCEPTKDAADLIDALKGDLDV